MMGAPIGPEMDVARLNIRAYAKHVLKEGNAWRNASYWEI
jgi:hypothetical protein